MKRAFSFFLVSCSVGWLGIWACGSAEDTPSAANAGGGAGGRSGSSNPAAAGSSLGTAGTTGINSGTAGANGTAGSNNPAGGGNGLTNGGAGGNVPVSYTCGTQSIQPTTVAEAHGTDGCCSGNFVYRQGNNDGLSNENCGSSTSCGWNSTESRYTCNTDGSADPGGKPKGCGASGPIDCAVCTSPELEAQAKPEDAPCIQCAKENCCSYVEICRKDAVCNGCLTKLIAGQRDFSCISNLQVVRAGQCAKSYCAASCPKLP